MIKQNLILIGAGGHVRACIDVIEKINDHNIAGIVGLDIEYGTSQFGYKVIGVDSDLPKLAISYSNALITIGQIKTPKKRIELFNQALQAGFLFPKFIATTAYVSPHAVIGNGSIVMNGATVNAGAVVGKNCIINSNALVEHDSIISDHCHISTGAIINGGVRIGSGSFIGSGSVIKESIKLGENCVIGMGQSIRHNLGDNREYLGEHKH